MMKKILFITPSLDRTGSEMVLWYLLNHLDRNSFTPYVFCLRKGVLYDQLPAHINKSVAYRNGGSLFAKIFRGMLKMFGIDPIAYQLKQVQKTFKADLWYVNTLLIPQAPPLAKKMGVRVATHLHEVFFAYTFVKANELKNIIDYSDTIVACSPLVAAQVEELKHPQVKIQPSFIDEKAIHPNLENTQKLKKKLGIENEFVWVISGTVAYMKGLTMALALAKHFKNEPVKIIWLGGMQHNGLDYYVQEVAQQLSGTLIFTGAVGEDYFDYLSLADGLLSLSKEESFSLVMLEAAFLGMPIVSFDTGMASRFIKAGMGKVVRPMDVDAMAEAMAIFHQRPEVDKTALKEASLTYTAEQQLPAFEKLLLEL